MKSFSEFMIEASLHKDESQLNENMPNWHQYSLMASHADTQNQARKKEKESELKRRKTELSNQSSIRAINYRKTGKDGWIDKKTGKFTPDEDS